MKVAVILSGVDRCFHKVVEPFMENIVKPYNADVFSHCWTNVSDRFGKSEPNIDLITKISKKVCFEDFSTFKPKYGVGKPRNVTPMFYGIHEAFNLIENQSPYSVIIRSRFDSLYLERLPDLEKYFGFLKAWVRFNGINKGHFLPRNNFKLEYSDTPFVADNFAVGDWAAMSVYANTYKCLDYHTLDVPECCLANTLNCGLVEYDWLHDFRFMSFIEKRGDKYVFESDYEQKKQIIL